MSYLSSMLSLQSEVLGSEEKGIIVMLVLFVVGMSYLFILPLIKWFVALQSVKLLSYIVCSLFVLVLYFIMMFFVGDKQYLTIQFIKVILQGIAFFGGGLVVIYSIQYLFKGKQKGV